jgi:ferredoxin-NADP reductase
VVVVPETFAVRVKTISKIADDVVSVVLTRVTDDDMPEFNCGSHIDLILQPDLIRQYSLCGSPSDRRQWTIAVLREANGRGGSAYVHDTLRPGAELSITGPRNNFPLVDAERYLFIAGGIGITPMLPMIQEVDSRGKDWELLYGGRQRSSMAYVESLAALGAQVSIVPQDECGLLDLARALKDLPSDACVYCCGPEALITAVETACADYGLTKPRIERFTARPGSTAVRDGVADGDFEVVLRKSARRVTIPAGRPITEVLEESGVRIPTSCTEGFCGTCETRVVSGTPDHRDEYLSEEERAASATMMPCVSRSKTPVLELDI